MLAARQHFTRVEVAILTWQVDVGLADLYHERGDLAAEAGARENAPGGIACLTEGIRDESLQRSFLGRTDVQKIPTP